LSDRWKSNDRFGLSLKKHLKNTGYIILFLQDRVRMRLVPPERSMSKRDQQQMKPRYWRKWWLTTTASLIRVMQARVEKSVCRTEGIKIW